MKRRIDLRSVDEISVSCLDDDYLCMHIPSEYRSVTRPENTEYAHALLTRLWGLSQRLSIRRATQV